ncbi:Cytochrome P450 [Canna indica]|uniref:Cytochrome P450 n=1 Tax=Canna indica TaxID=4628 RepID=A0AAQ3JTM7_9LILI|nr:Cytochrome P450 [Canna indica]
MDEILGLSTKARRNDKGWGDALEEVIEDHDDLLEDGDDEEEKDFVDVLMSLLKKSDRMDIVMSMMETKALMLCNCCLPAAIKSRKLPKNKAEKNSNFMLQNRRESHCNITPSSQSMAGEFKLKRG